MPDKRIRGATEYSTNPATMRARKRLSGMDPQKRQEYNSRIKEYTSMWATCARVSRRDEYRRATIPVRRNMLLSNINAVLEKRRQSGKTLCGLDSEAMIEKHLQKEANMRACQRGNKNVQLCLKGISLDLRGEDMGEHDHGGNDGDGDPALEDWPLGLKLDDGPDSQTALPAQGAGTTIDNDEFGQSEGPATMDAIGDEYDAAHNQDTEGQDPSLARRNTAVNLNPSSKIDSLHSQINNQALEQRHHNQDLREGLSLLHRKLDHLARNLSTSILRLGPQPHPHFDTRFAHPMAGGESRRPMMYPPRAPAHHDGQGYMAPTGRAYGPPFGMGMQNQQANAQPPSQHWSSFPVGGQQFYANIAPRPTEQQPAMNNEPNPQHLAGPITTPGETNTEPTSQNIAHPNIHQLPQEPLEQQTIPHDPNPAQASSAEDLTNPPAWLPPSLRTSGVTTPFLYSPAAATGQCREQEQEQESPMDPRLDTLWDSEQQGQQQ